MLSNVRRAGQLQFECMKGETNIHECGGGTASETRKKKKTNPLP
jgi:hypothetical protein